MDHDRAEGEGVAPQEYTAIKIELLETEWTLDMKKTLKKGSKARVKKMCQPITMLITMDRFSRWWFQICFIFTPTWGNDPI